MGSWTSAFPQGGLQSGQLALSDGCQVLHPPGHIDSIHKELAAHSTSDSGQISSLGQVNTSAVQACIECWVIASVLID